MKLTIHDCNLDPIREILSDKSSTPVIPVSSEDVDNFFNNITYFVMASAQSDKLSKALNGLDLSELGTQEASKVILQVSSAKFGHMAIGDLAELGRYINAKFPQADVIWGLSSSPNSEHAFSVFVIAGY